MSESASFAVAIANGKYATLQPLDSVVPDADTFVKLLETTHGFKTVLLDDRTRGSLLDEVDRVLGEKSLQGGALILLWSGHGEFGPDGQLRLMGRSSDTSDVPLATAAQLGEWAARTGAAQVLVIVDTCYSGASVTSALSTADAVLAGRAAPGAAWVGVLAASQRDELARSGALVAELKRVLTEGPRDESLRVRWSAYDSRIRGDDVMDAVIKEWPEPRQSPHPAMTGNPWPMLRNPLHQPRSPHRIVEHLLHAARGTSGDASFFTGRDSVLERIVGWLGRGSPGVCVVTGPAGSGKSAILGRIVSLSSPEERARLLAGESVDARLDPGAERVDAHLHCRGLDQRATIENFVEQLDLEPGAGTYDLLALAARKRREGAKPLVIVLDGLDEAGNAECREVALQAVQPLAREALILVGTREVPGGVGEPGLIALLGTAAETIDLGRLIEETLRDVRRYTIRRLDGVAPAMDAEAVAAELIQAAGQHDPSADGPFLLARLITSQLRRVPVDTSQEGWQAQLATSVATSLEQDLETTVLNVAGREHPTAARELLRALSCAHGSGFPADDVWPAVATALSPSGTTYTRDDVYSLLLTLGRHVVAGAEGDQGVYRVAHRRLVDHLRPIVDQELGIRLQQDDALSLARAVATLYESLIDEGLPPKQHVYLWRHSWRHFSDAGLSGLELMRRFVERDRKAFLPDMALALARVGSASWRRGSPQDAVTLHREAVEIRRELKDPLDLTLALFNLSFALGSVGDANGADEATSEATDIARSLADEPKARGLLAASLTAHALAQAHRGNLLGALRIAKEALALSEAEAAKDPNATPMVVSSLMIAARTAHFVGRPKEADEWSLRALSLFEQQHADSQEERGTLLELLAVRAIVELAAQIRSLDQPASEIVLARPEAAARILAIYREHGATGTVSDIQIADGMRLLATTIFFERALGRPRQDAPDPVALLDEGAALLSPMVARSAEAVLALAMNRLIRARLTAESDRTRAMNDLIDTERQLRPHIGMLPFAQQLGQVLDLQVTLSLSSESDQDILIKKEHEAVELARRAPYGFGGLLTIEMYGRLLALLEANGRTTEVIAARSGAAEVWRAMQDGTPRNAVMLAAMLSDLSFAIYQPRPIEALELTTEALDVLKPHDALDGIDRLRGACLINRSVALLSLGHQADARECLGQAVDLLDTGSPSEQAMEWLGAALQNLSAICLQAGEHPAALAYSRRALEFLEPLETLQAKALLPFVRINLGCALRACGFAQEGDSVLKAAIAELRSRSMTEDLDVLAFARSLDSAGSASWDEVLADLEDQPALVRRLELLRTRPLEELSKTIHLLRSRLDEPNDWKETRLLRTVARLSRARAAARFDALWNETAGALPDWLAIDPSLEHLLVAWWNAPTWVQSRDYLVAHPALLDPATDVLMDEFRRSGMGERLVSTHLDLLAKARASGIEPAYAPLLAEVAVGQWSDHGFSSDYLTDHLDELLAAPVQAYFEARTRAGDVIASALSATLMLTRRGEQAVAYRVLRETAFGISVLQTALKSGDAERAALLATICLCDNELTVSDRARSKTALAIGSALRGQTAEALAHAAEVSSLTLEPAERKHLVEFVTDAILRQPEYREVLVSILGRVSVPSSGGPALV